jgi:hypothetical protein
MLLILIAFFMQNSSFADEQMQGMNCYPSQQIVFGNWVFNRQYTIADGCIVQVTPLDKNGLIYREYVFDEKGRMMVFNSADAGVYETSTSQRNFYFLPAVATPTIEMIGDLVVVTMANGSKVNFNSKSGIIDSLSSDIIIDEKPIFDLFPGGHFEVVRYNGVWLDAGWAVGYRSTKDPIGKSQFYIDGRLQCSVTNSEIFQYEDPLTRQKHYQPILMLPQGKALNDYISGRCAFSSR